jgi:hypothetical protein
MRPLLIMLTVAVFNLSCSSDQVSTGEKVEIYLLKSFQTVAGKCQIDPDLSVLQDTALVADQEILAYATSTYKFRLAPTAIQRIKDLFDRTPFALTIDKQVVYYGFFKPSISSSSCDHSITMDFAWPSSNEIFLKLGYPAQLPGVAIEDKRNDARLLALLKKQGKLQ